MRRTSTSSRSRPSTTTATRCSTPRPNACSAGSQITCPQAGPYGRVIKVAPGIGLAPYNYSVALTDLGLDDHGDQIDAGTPLALGADGGGMITVPQDVDVFSVPLT